MTLPQLLVAIVICIAGVMLTRFLPFLVFRPGKPIPPFVLYIGRWLGPAAFGLLIIYCLRDSMTTGENLVEMLIATAATMALQVWRGHMMLSMAVGTALYMLLVRIV